MPLKNGIQEKQDSRLRGNDQQIKTNLAEGFLPCQHTGNMFKKMKKLYNTIPLSKDNDDAANKVS